jgi:hypothetical protein
MHFGLQVSFWTRYGHRFAFLADHFILNLQAAIIGLDLAFLNVVIGFLRARGD